MSVILLLAVVLLTWTDNSDNELGFIIERRPDSGGSYVVIATTTRPDVTQMTDYNVVTGQHYCYRVKAYNDKGDSAYTNEACTKNSLVGNLMAIIK